MTEGTSQGLFIVVAIVIFGIFIGLSYTVFAGEFGLQPQMVSLFNQALVKNTYEDYTLSDNLLKNNTLAVEPWFSSGGQDSESVFENVNGTYYIEPNKQFHGGIRLSNTLVEESKNYKLSFDITKESGQVMTLGGHLWIAEHAEVYIDGKQVFFHNNKTEPFPNTNVWSSKVYYPDDSNKHTVEIIFDTNNLNKPYISTDFNRGIFIQPNRQFYHKSQEPYRIKIENLSFNELYMSEE